MMSHNVCVPCSEDSLYCCVFPLKVVASRVNVNGSIEFVENNGAGIDGGALYLTSLSQVVLSPGANLTFEGNMGV